MKMLFLASTGEPVLQGDTKIYNGLQYIECILPPQAPGHRRRYQWIQKSRLVEKKLRIPS